MMRRVLGVALLITACAASGPVPLRWGEESCRHCHMTLADRRFGAEIVTTRGRDLSFDDAGCAAEHLAQGETPAAEVSSVWVIDYAHPDSLIAAATAFYVRSPAFHTPMGSGVVAVGDSLGALTLAHEARGTLLGWNDLLAAAGRGELRPH
jgi:copper chaperone NosL